MQQPLANGIFIDKRFNIQKQLADNLCNYCYLALDTMQDDRSVVLSFPKTELLIIPGFNAAFKDAWEHLSRARLNGMVKIIGGGIYESHPYAILQHTNHPTLQQLVKQVGSEQPPETVLNWATPLAVILDELHQADYVHSHIRPDSVQIGSQQQIIIGDFITEFALQRLGKFKDALTTLNASDYLSPEFIKSNYSGSYDQYLLATIIYWALSGKAPFASDLGEDYRMRVATTRVPSLPVTLAHSQFFIDVLDQALERNPTKRFAHCREFVNNLQTALQAEPAVESKSVDQKVVAPEQPAQPKQAKSPLVGMKAVAIETVSEKPKAISSKAAALSDEAIIAERAYQEPAEKAGKKHLLWWLVVLVGVAGTAYTMLNSHDADQITANSTRNAEPASVEAQSGEIGSVDAVGENASSDSIVAGATSSSSASGDSATGDVVADSAVETDEESADQAIDSAAASTSVGIASDTSEATETPALNSNAVLQSEDPIADPEQLSVNSLGSSVESEASQESESTQSSTEAFLSESADPDLVMDSSPNSSDLEANETQVTLGPASDLVEGTEANEVVIAENDQAVDNEALQEPAVVDTRVNTARPEWEEQLLASEIAAAQALINEVSAPAVTSSAESNGANTSPQNTQSTTTVAPAVTPSPVGSATQSQARSRNTAQQSVSNQAATTAQSTLNTNSSAQSRPQTERERIRAIKARELARIKAITDDCVIGGKMHREAAAGNLAYVKNCMSVGVSPDITQSNRWTVLHIAARSGYLNMAKLLVAQGAQVNAKAADGSTPLDMAIAARHPSLERFIISRGGVRSN